MAQCRGVKQAGPRGRQMSRAAWARQDRAVERITRREGREACRAGEEEARKAEEVE